VSESVANSDRLSQLAPEVLARVVDWPVGRAPSGAELWDLDAVPTGPKSIQNDSIARLKMSR